MNVVFMGTPEFAEVSLIALLGSRHMVIAVVTQPDRGSGRGQKVTFSPVKAAALARGIEVLQPDSVSNDSFISALRRYGADAIVVVAFGQKIPKAILDMPRFGCINVHGSLLPEYRGAAPINRAIMDGRSYTGVTTMYMDEGWDTGDMILRRRVEIEPEMTAGQLHDVLARVGAELLVETLDQVESGTAPRIPQDPSMATFAPKLTKEECWIDWTMSASGIANHVRGLNPFPCAVTSLSDLRLKVWRACSVPASSPLPSSGHVSSSSHVQKDAACGEIVGLPGDEGEGIIVKCGDGLVSITELQPESRNRMSAVEFVRGYHIELGQILR